LAFQLYAFAQLDGAAMTNVDLALIATTVVSVIVMTGAAAAMILH
jgi:hypothetical protein